MTQISKINGISVVDTKVTGFTYDGVNIHTITDNEGTEYSTTMNSFSATTISATTFFGDGSNLTGVGAFTSFDISGDTGSQTIEDGNTVYIEGGEAIKTTVAATDKVTIDLDITGTTAEATPSSGDKLIIYEAGSGTHKNIDWDDLPGAGGGEINTLSSVGGGESLYSTKVGSDLRIKSLTSTGNTVTISSTGETVNLEAGGGSSRVTSSVATTGATPSEIEKIDTLTAEATHVIEVFITAKSDDDVQWGVWKRTLVVTLFGGTCLIQHENSDVDKTSTGLNANSIDFTVNGTDIDIDVTGIAVTNIQWDSTYEIITKSNN